MREPSDTGPVPRRRAIYLLPNLLTTGTVFAGFYGIVASIDGHYTPACIAVFIAALLDGMDGRLARLTHTESEFGKNYDSLADMVAFGMAPAIIVYLWGLKALAEYGWAWGKLGWLAAFLYVVAAALRLARFNVAAKTTDRRFFEGLPSPSAAGLVASMVWLETQLGLGGLPALAVSTAGAQTTGVPTDPFPFGGANLRIQQAFFAQHDDLACGSSEGNLRRLDHGLHPTLVQGGLQHAGFRCRQPAQHDILE